MLPSRVALLRTAILLLALSMTLISTTGCSRIRELNSKELREPPTDTTEPTHATDVAEATGPTPEEVARRELIRRARKSPPWELLEEAPSDDRLAELRDSYREAARRERPGALSNWLSMLVGVAGGATFGYASFDEELTEDDETSLQILGAAGMVLSALVRGELGKQTQRADRLEDFAGTLDLLRKSRVTREE